MALMAVSDSQIERLYLALGAAEDQVSRLDERVKLGGLSKGWRARSDQRAAIAALSIEGRLVHPEDLLLHDLGTDVRLPDPGLARAMALLGRRRRLGSADGGIFSWQGVAWLLGRTGVAPPVRQKVGHVTPKTTILGAWSVLERFFGDLEQGETSGDARAAVEDVLGVLDVVDGPCPPLLAAASLMEAWRVVDPFPSDAGLGCLLASKYLLVTGRFSSGLLPIEVGQRTRGLATAWFERAPLWERLCARLEAIGMAAQLEGEELLRLGHQRDMLARKLAGLRRGSKSPALLALATDNCVVTAEMVATGLGISGQAARRLLNSVGGTLTEITGRRRYRVWRL